jgi:hypothetical protein
VIELTPAARWFLLSGRFPGCDASDRGGDPETAGLAGWPRLLTEYAPNRKDARAGVQPIVEAHGAELRDEARCANFTPWFLSQRYTQRTRIGYAAN